MKRSIRSRMKNDLFPQMPQSFTDGLQRALLSTGAHPRKTHLRYVFAGAAAAVLVAACFAMIFLIGGIGRKRTSFASETYSLNETTLLGTWTLSQYDYNGMLVSTDFMGARVSITFRDDGTAVLSDLTTAALVTSGGQDSLTVYSYSIQKNTVTIEGFPGILNSGSVLTYDHKADTLTASNEVSEGVEIRCIFVRAQETVPAKKTAAGVWSHIAAADCTERLTIRGDGTATLQVFSNGGMEELELTYTEGADRLHFTGGERTFHAQYQAEDDTLSVVENRETAIFTRCIPDLADSRWTLTGIEVNGIRSDPGVLDLRMYLEFQKDAGLIATILLNDETDREEYRYFVNGTSIDVTASDGTIRQDAIVYDAATDALRMDVGQENPSYMNYSGFKATLIFSRTPDAVIPAYSVDMASGLAGKWTRTGSKYASQGTDYSWIDVDMESWQSWLEITADGHAHLTEYDSESGEALHADFSVAIGSDGIQTDWESCTGMWYDTAADTICMEIVGRRRDYYSRTPDAEIPEGERREITALRSQYPAYFGLDTSKGLKVYVWQMSNDGYSCALLKGSDNKTDVEISGMKGTTIEEMLLILSTYDVPKKDIEIIPFRNPLSSYWYEIDEAYTEKLVWLLNGTPNPAPFLTESSESGETAYQVDDPDHILNVLTDVKVCDVDGDGRLESCRLSFGPTSGLFTVVFHVYRNGKLVYLNTFNMAFGTLSFVRKNGALLLKSVPQNSTEERFYAVSIENGAVVLTDESTGDTVEYWGTADTTWNMGFPTSAVPEEMLEGLWCALWIEQGDFGLGDTGDGDGLLKISFYRDGDEQYASFLKDGILYDGYSYTVEEGGRNEWKTDNPWYSFTFTKGDEVQKLDMEMDMDGKEPILMDLFRELYPEEGKGGWLSYLKCPVIEADALPYQQMEYYGAGEGFVGYLDIVDLNGDGNPVRVKVTSSDPNWFIDKGEEPELTVQIGRGEWTVNEVLVWDSLIYADLDPNDGHGNVLVSAKRADGTVVTYELHLEGDKVVCGHVAEGYCRMYAMSTDIYLCETAPLGGVDGERKISGETLVPESDWWTVPRYFYSSEKDRDWLVQHGQLLRLIRDLPCEIDGESAVLEAGTYLYLSRYHESLDRIEFLTEDNRTVLVRPQAGLLLDGAALTDYFDNTP